MFSMFAYDVFFPFSPMLGLCRFSWFNSKSPLLPGSLCFGDFVNGCSYRIHHLGCEGKKTQKKSIYRMWTISGRDSGTQVRFSALLKEAI